MSVSTSTLGNRLSNMLKRMRPNRAVQVRIKRAMTPNADPAESLKKLADGEVESVPGGNGNDNGSGGNGNGGQSIMSRMPGAKRDQAIQNLQQGFGEVVDLIRTVRTHLDQQDQRSDRMLSLMENLPDALEALPETNRNQARMAEAISTHVDQQGRQANRLNDALSGLAQASEHQSQVMGVLQQQIEQARQTDEQLLSSFGAMNQTLVQLSESSQANVQAMQRVTEHTEKSDRRMEELVRTNKQHMTALSVTSWVLAAAALGLAAWAVIVAGGVI